MQNTGMSTVDKKEQIEAFRWEIEDAKLENGEEEKLNELRAVVGSSAKIKRCTDEALDMLSRNQQGNVRDCLANAIRSISTLAGVDESKESMVDTLESLSAQLDDIISEESRFGEDKWALLTAGKDGKVNTMTISWGGTGFIWNKHVVFIFVVVKQSIHGFF